MGRTKVGGLGAKLLGKMGWKEGTGLGANKEGRTEPVSHIRRQDRGEGIGRKKSLAEGNWWETLMQQAYGAPKDGQPVDLFAACEGRRCRPHGTAKLARLEAQDQQCKGTIPPTDTSTDVSPIILETLPQGQGSNVDATKSDRPCQVSEEQRKIAEVVNRRDKSKRKVKMKVETAIGKRRQGRKV